MSKEKCCELGIDTTKVYRPADTGVGFIGLFFLLIGLSVLVWLYLSKPTDAAGVLWVGIGFGAFGMIPLGLFVHWNGIGHEHWRFYDQHGKEHFHAHDPRQEYIRHQLEWFGQHFDAPYDGKPSFLLFKGRCGGWFRKCAIISPDGSAPLPWTLSMWEGFSDCAIADVTGRALQPASFVMLDHVVRSYDTMDRVHVGLQQLVVMRDVLLVTHDGIRAFPETMGKSKYVQFIGAFIDQSILALGKPAAQQQLDPASLRTLWEKLAEHFHIKKAERDVA